MDKALKQRLVGASVLIIFAVIVLPMLLSGRSDRLKHESNQIEMPPKPEELSIETRRFPVGLPNRPEAVSGQSTGELDQSDTQATPQTDTGVSSLTPSAQETPGLPGEADAEQSPVSEIDEALMAESTADEPVTPQSNIEEPPKVKPITLTSDKEPSVDVSETVEPSGDAPRYLVQVASFSNEKNANALADVLGKENLPVLMDVVDRPAGRMHRVRVGPYAERGEADATVASLRTKLKDVTPRVLDLRPDDSAPVSTPSDPLVRWVVQVGSFSSSKSAEDLVAKLRLANLSAYSEKVSSSTGDVYKVRIGPELDRNKAAELARKVKAEHSLDTFVTTQE